MASNTSNTPPAQLPADLRELVNVRIDVSSRNGRCLWVAYVADYPSGKVYRFDTLQETQAQREAFHNWLRARFGLRRPGPYDYRSMEEQARETLALVLAEGEAETHLKAIADATLAAATVAPDLPKAQPYACREVYRVRKARATLAKLKRLEAQAQAAANEDRSAVPAYVFGYCHEHDWEGYTQPASHHRWRILRVTPRYLFVEPAYDWIQYGEENWHVTPSQSDGLGRGSVRLPRDLNQIDWRTRQRLAYRNVSGFTYDRTTLPPLRPAGSGRSRGTLSSSDLELLGLDAGDAVTAASVKAAFRRMARTAHPDTGGSAEAFQALNDAYERTTAALQKGGHGTALEVA
jgi:hypothetical protein